jgi:membrane protease subunit HflK
MFRTRHVLLLALGAYLLTGVYQVAPEERAVVRRFGAIVAHPMPGLGVGLPWGIDRVDRVPVRTVRQLRVGYDPDTTNDTAPAGQLLTGDQNLVNVQLVLDYAVGETDDDLDAFVLHREQVDATLTRAAEAAASEWVAGPDRRSGAAHRHRGAARVGHGPTRRAACPELRLGVRVQRASVALIAPPDEVRNAFEAVTQSQTAIRTKEFQAQQERDQRQRQADALRYRLEQEATDSASRSCGRRTPTRPTSWPNSPRSARCGRATRTRWRSCGGPRCAARWTG